MAKYVKQEMNDLDGSGKQRVYYRMQTERNINAREFVERIALPGSGLNEGSVLHVLSAMAEQMAYHMAQGCSVTIDGVGTFRPSLGLAPFKRMDSLDEDEARRNARSIEVDGILFRADSNLVKQTNSICRLERGATNRLHRSPYTAEERLALAHDFLEKHHTMRIADYMALTKLGRTTATTELKRLQSLPESGITTIGRGPSMHYVKRRNK